jgi:hypothetical protein
VAVKAIARVVVLVAAGIVVVMLVAGGVVSTVKARLAAALVPPPSEAVTENVYAPSVSAGEVKEPVLQAVAGTVVGPAMEQV